MFKIIAVIAVRPECAGQVEKLLPALIAGSRRDRGNLAYNIRPDALNPGVFIAEEEWESQNALDSHLAQPHFTDFAAATESMLAAPMALHKLML